VARLYEQLLSETNVDPARLERIHAPIGLDLGAVTPQEIAVSITAELIAVRRGKAEALRSASLRWFPKLKALR
jgi:xanthine dehydrogenase accessory factor